MGKRGPKPWEPTDEEVNLIRLYAGLGSTQEQIAVLIGKSVDTMARNERAKEALDHGRAETIVKVAGTLVKKALSGDTASAIFYLKTQGKWRETQLLGSDPENPLPTPTAIVDPTKLSDAALKEIMAATAAPPEG